MKLTFKFLFIMLLTVAFLAACGEDSASDDTTEINNEATEPEEPEGGEEIVGEEGVGEGNAEDESTDNEEIDEENDGSSGYADDQQVTLGETGIYDSSIGTYEITLNAIRTEEEIEGESPTNGMFLVTELTIKNVTDKPIEAQKLGYPELFDESDVDAGSPVYWWNGFEGDLEPGESIDVELTFNVSESSYHELVYGIEDSDVTNELRIRFEADDIE